MSRIKEQTVDVVIAAGSDGIIDTKVELDSAFTHCTGIVCYEVSNGGLNTYDIALMDDTGTHQDFSNKRHLIPGDGVALDDRFLTKDIENRKQNLKIKTKLPAATTAELRYQMIFRLEKVENA